MQRSVRRRKIRSNSVTEALETRVLPATFTVNSFADTIANDGRLTLREAIIQANQTSARDTIEFSEAGRVELQNGELNITEPLTIRGLGSGSYGTIIDGNEGQRIFDVDDVSVAFSNMRLQNGGVGGQSGGAIRVDAPCPFEVCDQDVLLDIDNVHFVSNSGRAGGAINVDDIEVRINDSVFRDNHGDVGGAIASNEGMTATITNTLFQRNSSSDDGGAIRGFVDEESIGFAETVLDIRDSRFIANSADGSGGAIANVSRVTVDSTVFKDNYADGSGGAIYLDQNVITSNSAFIDNEARVTGGAIVADFFTITNTSVLRNSAEFSGGIFGFTGGGINNSTIARNRASSSDSGAGVRANRIFIHSSIIAENTANNQPSDLGGFNTPTLDVRTSLIGTQAGTSLSTSFTPDGQGNIVGSAATPVDPDFVAVGRFGDNLYLAPLRPDSPAINRGSNPESLTTDQSGAQRVVGSIDMGAAEYTGASIDYDADDDRVTIRGGSEDDVITITENGTGDRFIFRAGLQWLSILKTRVTDVGIFSGAGDDSITATGMSGFSLFVNGGGGNDTIRGSAGDDDLTGASGNDLIRSGNGDDFVDGGIGNDLIYGGNGDDDLFGDLLDNSGSGRDTLYGENGDDAILGGGGDDSILGGAGDDIIGLAGFPDELERGNDYLDGGIGDDELYGGPGNDTLLGEAGRDSIEGGSGNDELRGGLHNDEIFGGAGADKIVGGAANDILVGGSGADSIDGTDGTDYLFGGNGADTLRGGNGSDVLIGANVSSQNLPTFAEINQAWRGSGNYVQRFTAVLSILPGLDYGTNFGVAPEVIEDGAADEMIGESGLDFFYARITGSNRDIFELIGEEQNERV